MSDSVSFFPLSNFHRHQGIFLNVPIHRLHLHHSASSNLSWVNQGLVDQGLCNVGCKVVLSQCHCSLKARRLVVVDPLHHPDWEPLHKLLQHHSVQQCYLGFPGQQLESPFLGLPPALLCGSLEHLHEAPAM